MGQSRSSEFQVSDPGSAAACREHIHRALEAVVEAVAAAGPIIF